MTIAKNDIEKVRNHFKDETESWGKEEVITDQTAEALISLGSELHSGDEIGLTDGESEFAVLEEFAKKFFDKTIEGFLNALESFVGD